MKRRALLAASMSSGGKNELNFPIYLNLNEVSSDEYRLDPTPESIAICDYFLQNAVFDGTWYSDLFFGPNELYIDGIEVDMISGIGNSSTGFYAESFGWHPHDTRYDKFPSGVFSIYVTEGGDYPKGTFRVYDDD